MLKKQAAALAKDIFEWLIKDEIIERSVFTDDAYESIKNTLETQLDFSDENPIKPLKNKPSYYFGYYADATVPAYTEERFWRKIEMPETTYERCRIVWYSKGLFYLQQHWQTFRIAVADVKPYKIVSAKEYVE